MYTSSCAVMRCGWALRELTFTSLHRLLARSPPFLYPIQKTRNVHRVPVITLSLSLVGRCPTCLLLAESIIILSFMRGAGRCRLFLLLAFISGRRTLTETDGWVPLPHLIIDEITVRGCASAVMSDVPWLPPPLQAAPLLFATLASRRRNYDPWRMARRIDARAEMKGIWKRHRRQHSRRRVWARRDMV